MARKLKFPFDQLTADGDSMLLEGARLGDVRKRLAGYTERQLARGKFPVYDSWAENGGVAVARYEDLPSPIQTWEPAGTP